MAMAEGDGLGGVVIATCGGGYIVREKILVGVVFIRTVHIHTSAEMPCQIFCHTT